MEFRPRTDLKIWLKARGFGVHRYAAATIVNWIGGVGVDEGAGGKDLICAGIRRRFARNDVRAKDIGITKDTKGEASRRTNGGTKDKCN